MARKASKFVHADGIPKSANFGMPSLMEWFIVLGITLAPLALLVWFVRYLIEMSRERRRLRIEVSKLAHELETLRGDREQLVNGSST